VLNELGQVALARDEFDQARRYFLEGLGLARDYGNVTVLIYSLAETALLIINRLDREEAAQRTSEIRRAAQLCGAVKPFFDHPLLLGGPGLKEGCKSLVDQVRAGVEDAVWEPAFAEGAAMPLDQMLALAARELSVE
jgi:hypothetical protein